MSPFLVEVISAHFYWFYGVSEQIIVMKGQSGLIWRWVFPVVIDEFFNLSPPYYDINLKGNSCESMIIGLIMI